MVVTTWLGRRKDGRLAAGRCGLAVPRQNGKNGILEIVELYKMVALGRKILHTAHEVKTARKAFVRLRSFFENERRWPEMAALVKELRQVNGQEAIVLTNGGSIEFVARSRGSGRGYTVDDLVCDEAQELSDEQLEALLPTISSSPSGDPQIIMTGTPPVDEGLGVPFVRMRNAGHEGKDRRLAWHEWSVDAGSDPDDRSLWAATNPSLGVRLNVTVVQDEREQMSDAGFLRERLGMWIDSTAEVLPPIITAEQWDALKIDAAPDSGRVAYGIKFAPGGKRVTLAAALAADDEPVFVEVVGPPGDASMLDRLVDWLAERWQGCDSIVIDGKDGRAQLLMLRLSEAGVRARVISMPSWPEIVTANATLVELAEAGQVSHAGQAGLRASVAGSAREERGKTGGWGFRANAPDVDTTPTEAIALAISGLKKPKRRARGDKQGRAVFA